MQKISCPSCGAEVQFRSHASVMAVCDFCKTTILKDAEVVKDIGKMADLFADYSPIQIGTSANVKRGRFSVIGRIQLRYRDGLWNEWYVLFDDGRTAWLGDASGSFTLTFEHTDRKNFPAFQELVVGAPQAIDGGLYITSDVRTAECIGGQGELPFKVGAGWQARVADFRNGKDFVTLDYSDVGDGSTDPRFYAGQAVTLEEMQCQWLRDTDMVQAGTGKFLGGVHALSCPSCGSNIAFLPGLTTYLVCSSCHAQLDASSTVAEVIQADKRVKDHETTLELGMKAAIEGASYELIGLMKRKDGEGEIWTEYLLHSARNGFLWLVEANAGWSRAKVQDDWPQWTGGDIVRRDQHMFPRLFEYNAKVLFVAGAFNWRVRVGDETRVIEFEREKERYAAEITQEELTWSLSSPVGEDQVAAWFGNHPRILQRLRKKKTHVGLATTVTVFMWIIGIVNAFPLLVDFEQTWIYTAVGIGAIYLPAKYLDWVDA